MFVIIQKVIIVLLPAVAAVVSHARQANAEHIQIARLRIVKAINVDQILYVELKIAVVVFPAMYAAMDNALQYNSNAMQTVAIAETDLAMLVKQKFLVVAFIRWDVAWLVDALMIALKLN